MAAVLNECTVEEQRAVVRFLWAKGHAAKDIYKEMIPVYGEQCLSRQSVYNWVDKFSQGRSNVTDKNRSGRPVEVGSEENLQRVEEMIRADRRITIDTVAIALGCSHGLAYSIVHDKLDFRKVSMRWVPRQLTDEQKLTRMGQCLEHLCQYSKEGEDMLSRIVTGDESWVHYYQPETKRASMQWKHPFSPVRQTFKVTPSAGKVMLTVFWDCQGVLLTHFQKQGETVNAAAYCEVLMKLGAAIKRKRSNLQEKGILLLHDNARPHTAQQTQETIEKLHWTLLDHPPYSPDLAPSDYHLFGPLKNHLGGKHFADDGEVEREVRRWLGLQTRDFYTEGIGVLVKRWDKCINVGGNYVEK